VRIYSREAKVLEGGGRERLADAVGRGGSVNCPGAHVVQQALQVGFGHRS
jgi:hypothetical protein